jgi:DNA polymerase-3 subunit delta'
MGLHPLHGHGALRERLSVAMQAGRLPPALLLAGAAGVGKQRLGLWIAQGLLCEKGPAAPCDACQPCRLALQLSHPDLHWFFPIPRPKGDESRQVDEAEESLGALVAARREQPLYQPSDGMSGLFLPLVRLLHRRARMRPAMGKRKVFIVAEADRLVPQEGSEQAANALLKVLEEPPPDTWFVLTSAEPAALLPTIRSRLVQLRVGRLGVAEVARFLREVPRPPLAAAEAQRRAELAAGSIGAALEAGLEDRGASEAARALLDAAARGAAARWRYAAGMKPFGARAAFTETLDAAAELLRDELAASLRQGESGTAPAARLVAQVRELERSRRLARGNVNPQLIAGDLLRRLAAAGGTS